MGFSIFGNKKDAVYKTTIPHNDYSRVELSNSVLDRLFIDEDITIPVDTNAPDGWGYRTVMHANFDKNIEGGSVQANNYSIDKIIFQRREVDEVDWQDIGAVEYNPNEQLLYEVIDKNIQNDFTYQYALQPVTSTVVGNRVVSDEVTADFEGVFLSDKDSNYKLLYNIELDSISHNVANSIITPLNSKYPIVVDGGLDYRSGGLQSLFVTANTLDGDKQQVDIKAEKLSRDRLLRFLKNQKPKILRQSDGETMLIRVTNVPETTHVKGSKGLATVSFNYVEIGDMNEETLRANDMLIDLEDEY